MKKILATEPAPAEVDHRFPFYAEMADPLERRGAIVRLHTEGWNIASIAGYLGTTRRRVYETMKRWITEEAYGLLDKPPLPHRRDVKATLETINLVRKLQRNPELGAFRIHAAWVHDYNTQEHWARSKRQDGRRSPHEVLGWAKGRAFSDPVLARIFAPVLDDRRVDQEGYVRFRNWRLYGERGLAGKTATIWITDEEVTIQRAEEPLARYGVSYQRDRRHFRQVTPKRIFETSYTVPQLPLPGVDPSVWPLAIELPRLRRRRRSRHRFLQRPLFSPQDLAGTAP